MSGGFEGLSIAVVGAAGRQGSVAVEMLARCAQRPLRLAAIDAGFDATSATRLADLGASVHALDVLAEREMLVRRLADADLVLNFAGPFFALGPAVLEAAIDARCDYVDICDDADAARAMIALHARAAAAGIVALIGAGSAPGVTNVLARLALDACGKGPIESSELTIAWATPVVDISPGIFRHIRHGLREPVPGRGVIARWQDLDPRPVEFPDPVGTVETVLFGHPEPETFRHCLGVEAELRGATLPPELMQLSLGIATLAARWPAVEPEVDERAYEAFAASARLVPPAPAAPYGALHVEAWRGGQGVRIQTVSDESMEETTVAPCLVFARMLANGLVPHNGVLSPELLDPRAFFEGGSARGRGRAVACRLSRGQPPERVPMRSLLAAVTGDDARPVH